MNKTLWIAMIVITIISIGGYFYPQTTGNFGASGTRFPNGLSADTTSPVAGEVRGTTLNVTSTSVLTGDVTLSGGASALTITTTNTATSSLRVGCIDTYATSTATAIRLSATTTPGVAVWTYGSCSGL